MLCILMTCCFSSAIIRAHTKAPIRGMHSVLQSPIGAVFMLDTSTQVSMQNKREAKKLVNIHAHKLGHKLLAHTLLHV